MHTIYTIHFYHGSSQSTTCELPIKTCHTGISKLPQYGIRFMCMHACVVAVQLKWSAAVLSLHATSLKHICLPPPRSQSLALL